MKEVFARNDQHYTKLAFLNWRTDGEDISNFLVLADGFLSSSILLLKKCLKKNKDKKADKIIFPILHNANHGIELYLKAITWKLNELLRNGRRIEGGHDIKQIYAVVKARIIEFGIDDKGKDFKEVTKELDFYITELYKKLKDDKGKKNLDFSRYPISNGYMKHFYAGVWENIEVDMINLLEIYQRIYDSLEDLTAYYYHEEFNL
ncbi:hypothetical protein ATO12_17150 [Aquimarina atlantica]|uniref:HEPN domain-containing protein n=1 Tax=Aquimarina atlantica TaxID=1317122 RepID=A0A023BV54_9FLAO|nr:hypothetical protein [Aquimarina atlantica]EZH73663.1 hypothetical protein ATO12_17150 [Aquimarina atlantica]